MKKSLYFVLSLLLLVTGLFSLELNDSGRFEVAQSEMLNDAVYNVHGKEFTINYKNGIFRGNSLYKTASGYISLEVTEENNPTILRFYGEKANFEKEEIVNKVINLSFSENKKWFIFSTGENLIVKNVTNSNEKKYPLSFAFAVDNNGNPSYYLNDEKRLVFNKMEYSLLEEPIKIEIINNLFVLSEKSLFLIENNNISKIQAFEGNFFDSNVVDRDLFFSTKVANSLSNKINVYKLSDKSIELVAEKIIQKKAKRTHEEFFSPLHYNDPNHEFEIGNSYAEIQQYGTSPYLHPGVDFLGEDYQEVYVVKSGYVKAILTTGGDPYWRVAISNENTSQETEGYLYAHLNQNSITVQVGDYIEAGEQLGTLYPWGYYDFTHIHFARVRCSGSIWNGNWWTIDNPLMDVINHVDQDLPVFQNAIGNDLFAFRDENGNYLEAENLFGSFDIIVKCYDICNSSWKIDVNKLEYKIRQANAPANIVYENFAFQYDFVLDTYHAGTQDDMILNTIYSRDNTCYSIGNYDEREYYHIITNSDGDSLITENDASEIFDSSTIPNGEYLLEVTIQDASQNEVSESIQITINNDIFYGDINGDGEILAYDAALILQYSVGLISFEPWQIQAGDVDGNEVVQAFDAALVLQYVVGIITEFPVQSRSDFALPEAKIKIEVKDEKLIFIAEKNLFAFEIDSAKLNGEEIDLENSFTPYLSEKNNNKIAIISAIPMKGNFLEIPLNSKGNIKLDLILNTKKVLQKINNDDNLLEINKVIGVYPNPFNPSTIFKLSCEENAEVSIEIYNIKGEKINSLVKGKYSGTPSFEWKGIDNSGNYVASGIYFSTIKINEKRFNQKLLLLK